MSTQIIIDKLKKASRNPGIASVLSANQNYLGLIFSISGAIAKTCTLVDGGFEPTVLDIFLPHIVLRFGPLLLANSLTKRFELTSTEVVQYIIGFAISIAAQHSPFLNYFTSEINLVAEYFGYTKIKNSPEDTFKMFSWYVAKDIAGMFLSKLIMKKKLRVSSMDLFKKVFVYSGVFYLRINRMNDYYIILVANIIPLSIKAIDYLRSKKKSKSKEEKTKDEVIEKKTRRKASVASQLEKTK